MRSAKLMFLHTVWKSLKILFSEIQTTQSRCYNLSIIKYSYNSIYLYYAQKLGFLFLLYTLTSLLKTPI